MNVAWIILDSLSLSATPFTPDGPDTMPKVKQLTDEWKSTIFTRAYSPGVTSPSSHAAFFTGKLPTDAGMHEANPQYTGSYPTIASAFSDTHTTYLVSSNRFIFNGLETEFDDYSNVLYPDPLFENGSDYTTFSRYAEPSLDTYEPSKIKRYLKFCLAEGTPVRSLANGIRFKMGEKEPDHQYSKIIHERISDFVDNTNEEFLIVSNYMDAHEPYSPSKEAINKFAPDTPENELPTGESGTEINKLLSSGAEGIEEKVKNMYKLYKASIWDMDRTLARTVELMLEQGTTVIITADHGYQVDRDHPMEENRINVPLIIIESNKSEEKERISKTVNISSLPKTSVQKANLDKDLFDGADLLDISEDQVSITEGFTKSKDNEFLVDVQGSDQNEYLYHAAVIEGDDKITTVGGDIETWNNTSEESELTDLILELQENSKINQTEDEIQYDDVTKQRLKELGYM